MENLPLVSFSRLMACMAGIFFRVFQWYREHTFIFSASANACSVPKCLISFDNFGFFNNLVVVKVGILYLPVG